MKEIENINKKIDNCEISELKQLSNLKRNIIYWLIDQIMTEKQFSSSGKEKLERLKNEVDTITTILKEQSYLDDNKLNKWLKVKEIVRNLMKKKMDLENEIFILEL